MSPLVSITGRLSSYWLARIQLVWSERTSTVDYGRAAVECQTPDQRSSDLNSLFCSFGAGEFSFSLR